MVDNYLSHHGVLGMKWGKRKNYYGQSGDKYRARKQTRKETDAVREAKKAHKKAINKAYNDIIKKESIGIGNAYGNATYMKAAKNMVNKGMDQKTAVSKAKAAAWRNSGLAAAGLFLYVNKDKLIDGVKKYANARAMQKANAGLARIGTMKLVKVAGNVYEYRMR